VSADHDHSHSHTPKDFGKAFAIGTGLNIAYVVVQVCYGIFAHSVALLADAGHNLGDVLGLLLAWAAMRLAKTRPTARRTYGLRRSSILAALGNAAFLLLAVGGISWEAIRRLHNPGEVAGMTVIWVAAIGVILNTITAVLFMSGRKDDLNIRGAFLHMAADAAVSGGVVAAGAVILFTGWVILDPIASLLINAVIVWGTWSLLRDSLRMALDIVPENVDPIAVHNYLASQPGVSAVHDLHIWSLSTTETALTAHLVKPDGVIDDEFLCRMKDELHDKFHIEHITVQCECGDPSHPCEQEPEHVL
jgi:cobalt-zinc-cadmium efflux system protein